MKYYVSVTLRMKHFLSMKFMFVVWSLSNLGGLANVEQTSLIIPILFNSTEEHHTDILIYSSKVRVTRQIVNVKLKLWL